MLTPPWYLQFPTASDSPDDVLNLKTCCAMMGTTIIDVLVPATPPVQCLSRQSFKCNVGPVSPWPASDNTILIRISSLNPAATKYVVRPDRAGLWQSSCGKYLLIRKRFTVNFFCMASIAVCFDLYAFM